MVLGEIGRAVVVGRVVGTAVAGECGTLQACLVPDNLLEKRHCMVFGGTFTTPIKLHNLF